MAENFNIDDEEFEEDYNNYPYTTYLPTTTLYHQDTPTIDQSSGVTNSVFSDSQGPVPTYDTYNPIRWSPPAYISQQDEVGNNGYIDSVPANDTGGNCYTPGIQSFETATDSGSYGALPSYNNVDGDPVANAVGITAGPIGYQATLAIGVASASSRRYAPPARFTLYISLICHVGPQQMAPCAACTAPRSPRRIPNPSHGIRWRYTRDPSLGRTSLAGIDASAASLSAATAKTTIHDTE